MTIPNNYRQLKATEKLLRGDLYHRLPNGDVQKLRWNNPVPASNYPNHSFWRRRHTKYVPPIGVAQDTFRKTKRVQVEFDYPHDGCVITREVQLVSLDDKYLTGLEIINGWDIKVRKYKTIYKFKKYRRDRIKGGIYLSKFE